MFRLITVSLVAGALAGSVLWAEAPKPFPTFEAKRVKPPQPGSTNRINVFIEPKVMAVPDVVATASGAIVPLAPGQYDWFWERVSPAVDKSGPGRLEVAMTTLATANTKVPAPRMQQMQEIARANGIDILRSTIGTQVSPALVLAVISVESAGRADAVSGAGAQGLMQLIAGGVKYLDWLMGEFDRDPILVLAGYNAGEGTVRKHAGVPPFAETRDYVPKVLAAFQVAKGLCQTPPELISDGCVFVAMN